MYGNEAGLETKADSEFKDETIGSVGGSGYEFCRGRVSALGHT